MHQEFTQELQHRLAQGTLTLTPTERAMMWRSQTAIWMHYAEAAPDQLKPLIYEAVELIRMAAVLAEHELESTRDFARITHQLDSISNQLEDWTVEFLK